MTTDTVTLTAAEAAQALWNELPQHLRQDVRRITPLLLNLLQRAYLQGASWGFSQALPPPP